MTETGSPAPKRADVHEYRLRVMAPPAWHAELLDLAAPPGQAPLQFDTPLELARHLSGLPPTRNGLR